MSSAPVTLAPDTIEAIAERVAELLRREPDSVGDPTNLIDASEVARRLGVSRDYIYEHAAELGARRIGDGPRARLRFDPERVAEALVEREAPKPSTTPQRRTAPRRPPAGAKLLPVGRPR